MPKAWLFFVQLKKFAPKFSIFRHLNYLNSQSNLCTNTPYALATQFKLITQLTASHSRSMFPSVRVSPASKIKQSLILISLTDSRTDRPQTPPFTISFAKFEGIPSVITDREWPALVSYVKKERKKKLNVLEFIQNHQVCVI